jgi:hypothetical protein
MDAPPAHQRAWRQEVVQSALPGVGCITYSVEATPFIETASERRARLTKNNRQRAHGRCLLQRAEWSFIERNAMALFDALHGELALGQVEPLPPSPTASPMGDTTAMAMVDSIANVLMPHGGVRLQPPTARNIYECQDHGAEYSSKAPLVSTARRLGAGTASVNEIRRALTAMGVGDFNVLVHPSEPRDDGVYAAHVHQQRGYDTISGCPHAARRWRYGAAQPLLAVSPARPELLYIPSLLAERRFWAAALQGAELQMVERLIAACDNGVTALLNFQLGGGETVESAIGTIAPHRGAWFHGCVHLRFALQCAPGCAQIHRFDQKRHRTWKADGSVKDAGSVALVPSRLDLYTGAKEAFESLVQPLAKVAQAYLVALPEPMRTTVLASVGLDVLEGIEFSYTSLNIFWDPVSCPTLPGKCWTGKRWVRMGGEQRGRYLHRDQHNSGWGAVLIFGAGFTGFEEQYVTLALELPCPGWSLVLGDFRYLLHMVRSGRGGLRFSIVLCNHRSTTEGVDDCGREVWAPVCESDSE